MFIFNWISLFERLTRLRDGSQVQTPKRKKLLHNAGARIRVEKLENRCLPATGLTASQEFISQVYLDLLGRAADPAALAGWSALVDSGVSREQVVMDIETAPTNEYQSDLVDQMYEKLLDRPADPAASSGWAQYLDQNGVEATMAGIAGSTEFFQDAGGTNTGFLSLLYQDLLNRSRWPWRSSPVRNIAAT
jgi:hypothetical protein